jgi:hypothetical protein
MQTYHLYGPVRQLPKIHIIVVHYTNTYEVAMRLLVIAKIREHLTARNIICIGCFDTVVFRYSR